MNPIVVPLLFGPEANRNTSNCSNIPPEQPRQYILAFELGDPRQVSFLSFSFVLLSSYFFSFLVLFFFVFFFLFSLISFCFLFSFFLVVFLLFFIFVLFILSFAFLLTVYSFL